MPSRHALTWTALLPLMAALAPAGLHAQQSTEVPHFRVDTHVVVLDVVVTDKKGNTDNNIARDDFRVTEQKQPQTIRSFEPPSMHLLKAADTGNLGDSGVRNFGESPLTILLLDEMATRFEDMAYARFQVTKYLNRQPEHLTQPTMLVVLTNKKMIMLVDWTQNKQDIVKAVASRHPDVPYRITGEPQAAAELLSDSLAALTQIAQATAGEHGRKNVIWLGHGFPALSTDTLDPQSTDIITNALHVTAKILTDARLTLYTIDPAGLPAYASASATDDNPDADSAMELSDPDDMSFGALTDLTGGHAFKLRNDLDVAVDTSERAGANYYTLSYVPENNVYDGKYRSIHVQIVNHPELMANTRAGYYADTDKKTTPDMVAFELTKAATAQLPYTGLVISATNFHSAKPNAGAFTLHIEPHGLSWSNQENGDARAEFTIAESEQDNHGNIVSYTVKELATTARAAQVNQVENAPLGYSVPVELNPRAVKLRIIVRDAANGRIGTADFGPEALQQIHFIGKSKRSK